MELIRLTEWPWLEIRMTARETDIHPEDVKKVLAFIGDVLFSDAAARGFGLTYDFRLLQNPGVATLTAIARWAAEPSRKDIFAQRCIACKTCVPWGWKFVATKAAMNAFFMITPPTCKTYLTTDFDDPRATMVVFDPPEESPSSCRQPSSLSAVETATSPSAGAGAGVAAAGDAVRRPASGGGGSRAARWLGACAAGLCSRDAEADRRMGEEQRRLLRQAEELQGQLQKANKELQETVVQLNERMTLLEAAVPWASTIERLGLPVRPAQC